VRTCKLGVLCYGLRVRARITVCGFLPLLAGNQSFASPPAVRPSSYKAAKRIPPVGGLTSALRIFKAPPLLTKNFVSVAPHLQRLVHFGDTEGTIPKSQLSKPNEGTYPQK